MMNSSFIKGHRDIISLAMIQRTKSLRPAEKRLTYSNVIERFLLTVKPNLSQQETGIAVHKR